jgi:hypothetical protein
MQQSFDTPTNVATAPADRPPPDRPAASLLADVLARWPTAPVSQVGDTGRWLTFERPAGGIVYLQRRAWDDRSVPEYLVVLPAGPDRAEQRRCWTLDEAIAAVKRCLFAPAPSRQRGALDDPARLPGAPRGTLAVGWAA